MKADECFEKACEHFENYKEKDGNYLNLENNPTKCNQEYQILVSKGYRAQNYSNWSEDTKLNLVERDEKLKTAEEILIEVRKGYEDKYSDQGGHFDIPRIMRDQGIVFQRQGRILQEKGQVNEANEKLKAARKNVEDAIENQREVYPDRFDSHPSVAATHFALGNICEELKDYGAAEKAYQKTLNINRTIFRREDHEHVVNAKNALDRALKAKSK